MQIRDFELIRLHCITNLQPYFVLRKIVALFQLKEQVPVSEVRNEPESQLLVDKICVLGEVQRLKYELQRRRHGLVLDLPETYLHVEKTEMPLNS